MCLRSVYLCRYKGIYKLIMRKLIVVGYGDVCFRFRYLGSGGR